MSLLLAYLTTLLLAQLAQQWLLAPAIRPGSRPVSLWLLQCAAVSLPYGMVLLLTTRPILSGIVTLAILAVFVVVNHAKYKALQEPLLFSDVYLYLQVFSHPRLFLPFLNIPLTVTAIVLGATLLYLAVWLEPAQAGWGLWPSIGLLLLLGACLSFIRQTTRQISLCFDPARDVRTLGLVNSLLVYALQAIQPERKRLLYGRLTILSPFASPPAHPEPAALDDVIVIQSESFFDARRLTPAIKPELLHHFDRIGNQARQQGRLTVPAWGANTLRPEFAFLSGIDNAQLEHYRFNPYQFLQHQSTPTLASYLQTLGYRCICIHPNHAAFFKRDRVFPRFGFDEFIDIAGFDADQTAGPYISDAAVQEKIAEILANRPNGRPLFIFAITMENHGPLHLENCTGQDLGQYYQGIAPQAHHDLTVYLRHLQNADQMLDKLTQTLHASPRGALLCWYGDHVPSMPAVYAELGFTDGRSDYLVWHNRDYPRQTTTACQPHDLSIASLSPLLTAILTGRGHTSPH